ncbi:UNVERIFIED_ORG: transposase [Microbispora rosea subsp. rosea]
MLKDGRRWYIAFCVEDGLVELAPNGKPPVGVDRGVKVAVVTLGGWMCDRQKAGLNRAVLAKGWGGLVTALEHKARYNGSRVVRVPAAYTSQRCSVCEAPTTRDEGSVNAP